MRNTKTTMHQRTRFIQWTSLLVVMVLVSWQSANHISTLLESVNSFALPTSKQHKQPQHQQQQQQQHKQQQQQQNQLPDHETANEPRQRKNLEFVHITKTAGSSIEAAAAKAGVTWGACHFKKIPNFGPNCKRRDLRDSIGYKNPYNLSRVPFRTKNKVLGEWWHTPHHWFRNNIYNNSATFVIVRNPYDRVLSEFYCKFAGYKGQQDRNSASVMNTYLHSKLRQNKRPRGMHYLPQHYYVFDVDGNQVIDHVLRFERLKHDFGKLMLQYDVPVALPQRRNARNTTTHRLTTANLTDETIRIINEHYEKEFHYFNYKMVQTAAELA